MDPVNIHVHLYYGVDPLQFRKGENAGCLYGYHFAESDAMALSYSRDHPEGGLLRLVRRSLKSLLGFDFIHTYRNRAALASADVIWTHTEREYLSVALLLLLTRRSREPLLLAQSVWLLDIWKSLSPPRRLFYRWLLGRADVLTTHSPDNAALARKYWGREATVVRYGLDTRDFPLTTIGDWRPHQPLRIASIGNDRDRDWNTLITAFENDPRYCVRVATRRKIWRHSKAINVTVAPAHGLAAQRALYEWADVIVVSLHPNHHVSGITVILEAVATGKPVIATAAGGLEEYFGPGSIWYVPAHDPTAMREQAAFLVREPGVVTEQMRRAQQEFMQKDLTTRAFADQHVMLTRALLDRPIACTDEPLPQSRT
ncbi:glycosyltransferase [Paraburkholderia saeva]|uniref:Glycosyl transferase n=1 Tax=Paraburkholderia saeva TaxID=2777537 RepID=A0A9N8RXS4_9BURK|nr:glycosyltransferase [Paraburkholderia saeva]CAG4891576.1 hypothetical protein R52603_01226 [Paraburkholderia saeva]CAG4895705.1 hypothetical protein R70241_02049 [Paraburkholderia saeva]CAG4903399.1 hypothetical protein LMG31841_03229 [Paraburkholderia saeva]